MTSPYSNTLQPVGLGVFANLGLSATQSQQIQSIVGQAQNGQTPFSQVLQKVEALLTPAQQATFKNDMQQLTTGIENRRHHFGAGGASPSLSSLLSSSSPDAFGATSSTTPTSSLTTDAFGNPVSTPGSALADAFGVVSSGSSGSFAASSPNASNVYSPFQTLAAQYQVQQQLQASSLESFFS